MAESKNLTVLTLGSQRVGGAVFDRSSNGDLVLKKYEFVEMMGDPTIDATRPSQLKVALAELASNLKLKGSAAWYAVAGHAVFTRFVKLPPVQGDKAEQLAEFEAKQNVPFDLSEVSWDYDFVNPEELSEREIAIVAMKRDALNDLNLEVAKVGIKALGADLAPVALYNAFRHSYPDVSECAVIIDLGARSTNVVFAEGRRMFIRNILTGGASVTNAVSKEFNLNFSESEQQKVSQGFIALGGTVEDHADPGIAALSKVVRNSMTKLHGEILRTITYYRSQQGGSAPQRIFIAGGGAAMGYVADFFQEKFKLPVEIFNPLRGVKVVGANADTAQADAHCMGELIGLALKASSACPVQVELLADNVKQSREAARRGPILAVAGLCLWGLGGASVAYFKKAEEAVKDKQALVQKSLAALADHTEELTSLRNELDDLKNQGSQLQAAVNDRSYWIRLLSALNQSFEDDFIWLTLVEPLKNGAALSTALSDEVKKTAEISAALPGMGGALFPSPTQPSSDGTTPVANPNATSADGSGDKVELRIVGLYRKNDKGQQVVYDFTRRLAALSEFFDKEKINVTDKLNDYCKAELGENNDRYAYRFEIRLPLAQPMQFTK
jgi:type IV pilus assembly protein PilM